jgi:hypothetical protein
MLFALILGALITWFLFNMSNQVMVGSYQTKFFDISPNSVDIIRRMKRDGVSEQSRFEFATMEDRFLLLVKQSTTTAYNQYQLAYTQSQMIRERFPAYEFEYHDAFMDQIEDAENKSYLSKLFNFGNA